KGTKTQRRPQSRILGRGLLCVFVPLCLCVYSPNTNNDEPAAIATYCFPSTANDIGLDRIAAPSCKSQSGLPVSASSAKKFPSSVPPNTKFPAVDSKPAIGGVRSLNSHRGLPVVASHALTLANAMSPSIRRPPPA